MATCGADVATKINENTELSMPIRNLMAMVVGATVADYVLMAWLWV